MKSNLDLDKIGTNLYYFRKTNNLSIKEVAKLLNLCPSQYIMYENGDLYITLPMLDILSRFYFVSASDLLYPDPNVFDENILKTHKNEKPLIF